MNSLRSDSISHFITLIACNPRLNIDSKDSHHYKYLLVRNVFDYYNSYRGTRDDKIITPDLWWSERTEMKERQEERLSPLPKIGEGFGEWFEAPSYEEGVGGDGG